MLTWDDDLRWSFDGEVNAYGITAEGEGMRITEVKIWAVRDKHDCLRQLGTPMPASAKDLENLLPELREIVEDGHPFRGKRPAFKDWTEGCHDGD